MKKNIRIIIALIAICVMAVVGFNFYTVESQKKEVLTALESMDFEEVRILNSEQTMLPKSRLARIHGRMFYVLMKKDNEAVLTRIFLSTNGKIFLNRDMTKYL